MTWLPRSNYTTELYCYLKEVSDNLCIKNIPVADSYYAVLVRASGTLTALQADYNNFTLTKQIPNLNIQTKMTPQTPQVSAPKQITLAKRKKPAQKQKENIISILSEILYNYFYGYKGVPDLANPIETTLSYMNLFLLLLWVISHYLLQPNTMAYM